MCFSFEYSSNRALMERGGKVRTVNLTHLFRLLSNPCSFSLEYSSNRALMERGGKVRTVNLTHLFRLLSNPCSFSLEYSSNRALMERGGKLSLKPAILKVKKIPAMNSFDNYLLLRMSYLKPETVPSFVAVLCDDFLVLLQTFLRKRKLIGLHET